MDIKDKVALVTGGARRVGRAISLGLAEKGANLVVNYNHSAEEAKEVVKLIRKMGREAIAVKADVSKKPEVYKLVDKALNRFGRIDILVNNAGIFFHTPFLEIPEEDWDLFMDVNLKSVFLCSQRVAITMNKQSSGKIINIADSAGGIRGWKDYIPYCVSKAGVIMLTKTMAKALAPNVQVNAVAPGPVLLPAYYLDREKKRAIDSTLLKRVGSPEDVAKAVIFLVESDYITGEIIAVDGGSLIAFPLRP
ncbi:MAG TPA: 3-oxoacyl-ACP reductase family protein [Thermodesulfobacteriota bacterium]|nr:3-oxoacyl-ACP reductase family protein [Thermodesulfobacteriota bacterium]